VNLATKVTFATKYGPWALVSPAPRMGRRRLRQGLGQPGVNWCCGTSAGVLDQVAAEIASETSAQTHTLAVDLAQPDAASTIAAATSDLAIGFLVYCAGADPNSSPSCQPDRERPRRWLQRNAWCRCNCAITFAPAMVERGSGGIVIFGSGARISRRTQHGSLRRIQSVRHGLAEALWAELHDKGVDVLASSR